MVICRVSVFIGCLLLANCASDDVESSRGKFLSVWQGADSELANQATLVSGISTIQQLEHIWPTWPGSNEASETTYDFSKRFLVGIFLGPSPGGTTVTIDNVSRSSAGLQVAATKSVLGFGCLAIAVVTHPYHVVSIARNSTLIEELSVTFELQEVTRDCR